MDRNEACEIARSELRAIEASGYAVASEHIETVALKEVSGLNGASYKVELSYHWDGDNQESIRVICRVTAKHWFSHEHLEESITLP